MSYARSKRFEDDCIQIENRNSPYYDTYKFKDNNYGSNDTIKVKVGLWVKVQMHKRRTKSLELEIIICNNCI